MAIKLPLALAVVLAPAARTTTSALAPETREIRDGADVLASFGTVRGLVKKMDIGALKNGQRRAQVEPTHECPSDSVLYIRGVASPPEQGCDGKCCVGTDACYKFTGCVKKDGSCAGERACWWAYAPGVIEASCLGDKACDSLSTLGTVDSSCNADDACHNLGLMATADIGTVSNSCNAKGACVNLGKYATYLGTVDNSCNAKGACTGGANNVGYWATIKSITGSCNSEKHKSCVPLQGTYDNKKEFGDITQFKRDFRVKKTRTEDIEACMALCAERVADPLDDCRGIKWRQGVQKPCRIFKGGFSEGKCHDKDLCMDL